MPLDAELFLNELEEMRAELLIRDRVEVVQARLRAISARKSAKRSPATDSEVASDTNDGEQECGVECTLPGKILVVGVYRGDIRVRFLQEI